MGCKKSLATKEKAIKGNGETWLCCSRTELQAYTTRFPLNPHPFMFAIASLHKSMFLWRGKSRSPVLFALLLTAWPTIGTSFFPSPSAHGWGKESRPNSPRQSLGLSWAISSTSHMQLNISFCPWHEAAEAGKRWGPQALPWPTNCTLEHMVTFALLLPNCELFQMLSFPLLTPNLGSVQLLNSHNLQNLHNSHKSEFLHSGQTRSSRSAAAEARTSKVTSSALFSSPVVAFPF